ncbi:MAG TPA: biotin/lipoyl-containing protein [Candidatus Nanopelagicales bacterium]|nr:biotin/lipoyl-containing protein [Candidatus Nanopelagicales bacterium]
MRYFVTLPSGREIPVDVTHLPTGRIQVKLEGRELAVDAFGSGPSTHLSVEGRGFDLWVEGAPPQVGIVASGRRFYARVENERSRDLAGVSRPQAQGAGLVRSPMPGRVLKVLIAEGDEVRVGQPLVVIEAMKMENELGAERNGVVKKIFVSPGATVEGGARLLEVG